MRTLFVALCPVLLTLQAAAAVVLVENVNLAVPMTVEGAYLNPATGGTSGSYPGDWDTAPWINPFMGGVYVATSALLRPVVTGVDQMVNLAEGTLVDGSLNFAAGESGSSTHMGAGPGQFVAGTPGYVGFAFQPTAGGDTFYGWMRVRFDNGGPGALLGYAWEDTAGVGIVIPTGVPEPGRAVLLLVGVAGMVWRRRR